MNITFSLKEENEIPSKRDFQNLHTVGISQNKIKNVNTTDWFFHVFVSC